jgi:hypothetical protein
VRGEISSGKHAKRHPLDWYVDEIWCARQLREALNGFRLEREWGLKVWDPACGLGNTLQAAWEAGLATIGSDLVDNFYWEDFAASGSEGLIRPEFFSVDFIRPFEVPPGSRLEQEATAALERSKPCSIVCNPPYSYRKDNGLIISEAFARQALKLAAGRVCLLVPSKWLAAQSRYRLFSEHPPAAILHLCQRPSMPPGDRIAAMGNRAFRGGMVDYCWVVWEAFRPTKAGDTRVAWLPPLGEPIAPVEVLA